MFAFRFIRLRHSYNFSKTSLVSTCLGPVSSLLQKSHIRQVVRVNSNSVTKGVLPVVLHDRLLINLFILPLLCLLSHWLYQVPPNLDNALAILWETKDKLKFIRLECSQIISYFITKEDIDTKKIKILPGNLWIITKMQLIRTTEECRMNEESKRDARIGWKQMQVLWKTKRQVIFPFWGW
jgi:hypothetical protein